MSFDRLGYHEGRQHGEADAALGRARRPRPRFLPALISDRYRDSYMRGYKQAYDRRRQFEETQIASDLASQSKAKSDDQTIRNEVFKRGWRDGFLGKKGPPKALSGDDSRVYEHGHRRGSQHRNRELLNRMRQRSRDQHSR